MSKKSYRIAIVIVIGVSLIALSSFWPKSRVELDGGYRLVMGTFGRVVAVAADSGTAKKCIEAAFEQLELIDDLMSDYKADSELSIVNREAYKGPVKVGKPVFEVLQKALEFSRVSEGAFDITVGALEELWRSAADANHIPGDGELQQARSRVGYEKLILDANEMSVRFAADGMKLDLGGIAKGYAIDKAVEVMQNCGAIGGMVDIGGDIRCFGGRPRSKSRWLIGLQDPGKEFEIPVSKDKSLLVLELTDTAVATSGHYRRFALIDGKKYSHIINAKTGYSSDELRSVTIISKSATDADALATAVSVMGAEKGLALIETIPQTEAILIPSQPRYELLKTSGAEKYIK